MSLAKLLGFIVIFIGYANPSYSQPKNIIITILQGNKSTHKITLDQDPATAWGSKNVKWVINDPNTNNVKTFRIVTKSTSPESFKRKPSINYSTTADGDLKFHLFGDRYEYRIEWYDNEGQPHTHDPKISIKPSFSLAKQLLILCLLGLAPILLVVFAYNKLKARRT